MLERTLISFLKNAIPEPIIGLLALAVKAPRLRVRGDPRFKSRAVPFNLAFNQCRKKRAGLVV